MFTESSFAAFQRTPRFNSANYAIGHAAEIAQLGAIRAFFDDPNIEPLSAGHTFDFESPTRLIELKTRRVKRLTYYDTAIGANKIRFARCSEKEVVFVFGFTDGLFYWRYDPALALRAGPLLGVPHHFIPVSELKPMF